MLDLSKIKELRLQAKLTQIQVAVAVGVSPEAFRNWERGAITPRFDNEAKLEAVLLKKIKQEE